MEIEGSLARVDFGFSAVREVDVSLVDVKVGQYVLVHTGFAIQVMEEQYAQETLKLWREILEAEGPATDQPGE